MSDQIKDGRGRGFLAAVNKQGNQITRAVAVDQHTKSALDGNYFEATTGQVTLTTDAETGVVYLKNNELTTIVVDKVFIDIWASTGGDANGGIIKYWKNPTVTGGTSITPVNTNFAHPDSATVDLKSLTTIALGTVWWIGYFEPKSSVVIDEGKFVIPPGYSFGLSLQAPAGNTNMKVNINIAFFRFDIDLLS